MLEYSNKAITYINSILFHNIIRFLAQDKIKIVTKKHFVITSQRQDDNYITNQIIIYKLIENQLQHINTCLIFFEVIHLSDTTRPEGKMINSMNLVVI